MASITQIFGRFQSSFCRSQKFQNNSLVKSAPKFDLPQLDGLRAIAFTIVFMSHAGGLNPAHYGQSSFVMFLGRVAFAGWSGVDLFFVLSAYLITTLLLKEQKRFGKIDLKLFFMRRALRIWPLYYVAVALGIAFFTPNVAFYWELVKLNTIYMGLFLSNIGIAWSIVNPPNVLLPLWSISMEEQFYFVWGITLFFVNSKRALLVLLASYYLFNIIIRYRYHILHVNDVNHAYFYATYVRSDPIIFGIAVSLIETWCISIWEKMEKVGYLFFLIGLAIIYYFPLIFPEGPRDASIWNYTVAALAWCFVLVGLLRSKFWARLFSWKYARWYGRLTFEMYIVHGFVIFSMLELPYFSDEYGPDKRNFIGLPITILIALGVRYCFTSRFDTIRKRLSRVQSGFDPPSM